MTKFQNKLLQAFEDKKLATRTIQNYLRYLQILNNNKPLEDIDFLFDHKGVINYIKNLDKSLSLKLGYLSAIATSIQLPIHGRNTDKLYLIYSKVMKKLLDEYNDSRKSGVKTEKQEKNWISMKELKAKLQETEEEIDEIDNFEGVVETNKLISWLLLALYTLTSPRRNRDYLELMIVRDNFKPEDLSEKYNYYLMQSQKFVFNQYKTAKLYSRQVIDVPKELQRVLEKYIRLNPYIKDVDIQPLLINANGPYENSSNITRRLNTLLGKKVGSSMIRHAFLTDKFGDVKDEQERIATEMGHSREQQGEYIVK